MAGIPFQATHPLDSRLSVKGWTGITGSDGNLTQTMQWPADMKSVAVQVSIAHFTRNRANPFRPTRAESEAEMEAIQGFRNVFKNWTFKLVYRVAVPEVGSDVTIDVIAEPAITLKATVELPKGLYQDLFMTVDGYGMLSYRRIEAGGKVTFSVPGAPKSQNFHAIVGVGDVVRWLPQTASTTAVDLGALNYNAWIKGAREVSLRVEYPADARMIDRGQFFFIRSDGTTIYVVNRADAVHRTTLPTSLAANQLVGGAQFVYRPTKAMLPPGEYVLTTSERIDSEEMHSLLTRLRAGEPPANTGLYRVTIPAEGDVNVVIPGREVYIKEKLSRPKTSPLETQ